MSDVFNWETLRVNEACLAGMWCTYAPLDPNSDADAVIPDYEFISSPRLDQLL